MSAVGNDTSVRTETRDDVTRTKARMKWTKKHDILLCREILLTELYKYKESSVNRGKAWSTIAGTLNCSQDPEFKVTQRSVRERFNRLPLIQGKYKYRNNKAKKSSDTSAETTELNDLIKEIREKEGAAEKNGGSEGNMKKLHTDRPKAEEARKRVSPTTRTLCEEGEDWSNSKRKRSSGNDTTEFLKETSLLERVLRENRLELKKILAEVQARAAEQTQKQLSEMIQLLQQVHQTQEQLRKQQQHLIIIQEASLNLTKSMADNAMRESVLREKRLESKNILAEEQAKAAEQTQKHLLQLLQRSLQLQQLLQEEKQSIISQQNQDQQQLLISFLESIEQEQ